MLIDQNNIDVNFLIKFAKDFYLNELLVKNLASYIKQNKLTLDIVNFDKTNNTWSGELNIHIIKGVNTYEVVNYIVGVSQADEISMPTRKTIRLWWD